MSNTLSTSPEGMLCHDNVRGLWFSYVQITKKFTKKDGSTLGVHGLKEGMIVFRNGTPWELYLDDYPHERFLVSKGIQVV